MEGQGGAFRRSVGDTWESTECRLSASGHHLRVGRPSGDRARDGPPGPHARSVAQHTQRVAACETVWPKGGSREWGRGVGGGGADRCSLIRPAFGRSTDGSSDPTPFTAMQVGHIVACAGSRSATEAGRVAAKTVGPWGGGGASHAPSAVYRKWVRYIRMWCTCTYCSLGWGTQQANTAACGRAISSTNVGGTLMTQHHMPWTRFVRY